MPIADPELPSFAGSNFNVPIAIVGMSCRLPGGINNLSDFWDFCSQGRSAWSTNPKSRFPNESFFHPDASKPGFVSSSAMPYMYYNTS